MKTKIVIAALVLALGSAAATGQAISAPCKDEHGKFMKCAPVHVMKPVRCKDEHGKFMKCRK